MHSLYEKDYDRWLRETVERLKEREFSGLDVANLIEELEGMSKSERQALENNLIVVLKHLLKYQFQPEKRSNSWRGSIREHRRRIRRQFQKSPSLRNYYLEVFEECYQDARAEAATETGLQINEFPPNSPYNPDVALDPKYLPE